MLSNQTYEKVKNIAVGTGKNFISLSALQMTGLDATVVNAMPNNVIARNMGRGFLWYVADEAEGYVLGDPDSNFVNFRWENAVDDTVFNGILATGIELTGAFNMVRQNVNFLSGNQNNVFATALVKNILHEVVRDYDLTPVKHITKFFSNM